MTGPARLLAISERVCGPDARAQVFEPLVADWQREWLETRTRSRVAAAVVLLRGAGAFAIALVICANPLRGAEGAPARRFLRAVVGFAAAAMLIQAAPFRVLEALVGARDVHYLRVLPPLFAAGVALAMLPAAMLSTTRGFGRGHVIAALVAVGAALGISSASAHRSVDPQVQLAFAVLALGFAVLGRAVVRAHGGVPPRVGTAAVVWFGATVGYQLVQFGSRELGTALQASAVALWLPPIVVLMIGVAALRGRPALSA